MNPREQGDLGERSAVEWLWSRGCPVFVPFGHSPDIDLMTVWDGRAVGVQVKTCGTTLNSRWNVVLCTRGGNQSWNRIVKRFSPDRYDYLFVLVGDGRRWFIPSDVIDGTTAIALGGPKYAEFEVEPGRPFEAVSAA